MAVAPRGAALYTSGTREGATNADILLIKWSKWGRVIWKRQYNPTPGAYDAGGDVVVDRDGNVTVLGLAAAGLSGRLGGRQLDGGRQAPLGPPADGLGQRRSRPRRCWSTAAATSI